MSEIIVHSDLVYEVQNSTIFLFKVTAATTDRQTVLEEKLIVDPKHEIEDCQVGDDGNRIHRIVAKPGTITLTYDARIQLSPDVDRPENVNETPTAQLPPHVLTFLNPSRYCESDLLARFAFEEFGALEKGFGRVQAICDWVYRQLVYTPGSTIGTTTAADVLLQRTGVCRDYAHLAIALCRGVGIPARYVSGYAVNLNPPDYHGFMEAFLGGQWYLFDPTRLASTLGLVRIGVGRDAADVAFATVTGSAFSKSKTVSATLDRGKNDSQKASAVSTA